jgi:N12 class adenine-specific DNA methylase
VTLHADVKGVDPEGSNMACDFYMKIRYLETLRPSRSAVLASGTPVTNTMGELFSISRFLQPRAIAARGLSNFDAWAQTFANTGTELEQNPDGTYKAQTRLSKFVNMPELYWPADGRDRGQEGPARAGRPLNRRPVRPRRGCDRPGA